MLFIAYCTTIYKYVCARLLSLLESWIFFFHERDHGSRHLFYLFLTNLNFFYFICSKLLNDTFFEGCETRWAFSSAIGNTVRYRRSVIKCNFEALSTYLVNSSVEIE